MTSRIPIVFSIDHNYVMQAGVCIYSLLINATCKYDIYILVNNDVTHNDKKLLQNQVNHFNDHLLSFISIGNIFKNSYQVRGISIAAYSRLLIPWLLEKYDKVIYSDVDVIFRLSLEKIYSTNIENYYFGAVKGLYFQYNPTARKYVKNLHLNPDNYVNSGFLLINCKLQRLHNLREKFLRESNKKYKYQDQDIINIVSEDRISIISPQYCITPAFYKFYLTNDKNLETYYGSDLDIKKYAEGKDCIIHYAGNKPWNSFTFAWNEWWQEYKKSIFYSPNFELEISNILLSKNSRLKSFYWKIRKIF